MKTAIVSGSNGQDGSYLCELLIHLGYDVVGIVRRASTNNLSNIEHIKSDILIEFGDITDPAFINYLVQRYKPDEFYNLAAQSFVPVSWNSPVYTAQVNGIGPLVILDALKDSTCRFFQASTSEMFGKVRETPQSETTPFYPRSPYGVSKVYAYYITQNYRESYDMFACSAITFNHESERRGLEFVTRKISNTVAKIKFGKESELRLGNLDVKRDWGYAKDYVKYFHKMVQQPEPEDFVIGTGENHTVREFCEVAFRHVGLNYMDYVVVDPAFYRPAEVEILLANPNKAKQKLGFKIDTSFEQLVRLMVDNDLRKEYEV